MLLGFFFTADQRKSLINLQTLWGSSIQKNVLNYINEASSTFYYREGILKGGEVIEEKFYYCPSKIMKSLPLKNPEVFEIEGEYYLFFEDFEGNLMAFKQPNLLGIEKPIQWLTEKTWGNIIFFYGIFLISLIYILNKILNPIKNLSKVAKEVGSGKDFYEIKPIFGKEIEDLSTALKNSFIKLQEEEKTLKETLNNLPVGVSLFEGKNMVLLNELVPIKIEEILELKDEGIFEKNEKIYQYKKVKINEKKWIFFSNDITAEIEKEKLALISNIARIVAHEIKNPLTPIKLSIEYLKEIFKKKKNEFDLNFPKVSEEILESIKDLESISSEFSDFTRLPALKKEKINLNKILKEWLSPFVLSGKILLNLPEEEIYLNLDLRLFKRAILNIINNAWQSAVPEPIVSINLKKEKNLILEIIDNGPGVPDEILPKIFEPYFTTKTSGTGLGLFISKKIIEEHKGKIFAENTKDKGLKITILFP
jgi:nitrogen fixation/metabolism regulation signal transduction histidine kinase